MKKSHLFIALTVLLTQVIVAQTNTIANYDFNSASSYPILPTTTASGISCSGTSTELFQIYSGVITTPVAFVQNSTAGNAIAMSNSSGSNTHNFVFQLGGSDLINYQSYKMYLQPQRSTTGATLITVAYSTNGSSYTNLSNTYPVTTTYSDMLIDLSSATVLNNVSSVYIKLMVSGASSASGTIRLDNIQIQATRSTTGGGTSYPWVINGNNIGFTGNVGVGTPNPLYNLDVIGDARIGNNLIVGGGILISQKVQATSSMKTDTIHSVTGETKFTSKVILKQQFQVDGSTLFNGTVQAGNLNVSGATNFANGANVNGVLNTNNLNVSGNTNFVGAISTTTDITAGGSVIAKQVNIGDVTNPFYLGTITMPSGAKVNGHGSIGPIVWPPVTCLVPLVTGDNVMPNRFTIFRQGTPSSSNLLDFRNDGTDGFIDFGFDNNIHPMVQFDIDGNVISTPVPNPILKINGSCYGNVEITKGGGFTSIGNYFEVGNPTRNASIASNIFANGRTGQRVTVNSGFPDANTTLPKVYNTQLFVNKNKIHALSVFNTIANSAGDEVFTVFGDGKTVIGDNYMPAGYQLAVKGKVIAEEVVVQLRSTWPDYVFAKNYNLKPLSEIEAYIKENKHLQNIPSAKEIEKEGVTLGTIVTKQMEKIEELTLYLIEQQKQIEELKKLVGSIKK